MQVMCVRGMVSARMNSMNYAIREIAQEAALLEKQGHKVLKLNIGDPLKYDFEVPEPFQEGLRNHADKGFYGPSQGVQRLREAITKWEGKKGIDIGADDVYVTNGVSEGVMTLFASFIDEGDEVILPKPVYPLYKSYSDFFGARIKFYDAINPDPDEITEMVTDKTKMFVLINPNNPTGQIYPQDFLKAVADLDTFVVADEIYDLLRFDGKSDNMAKLREDRLMVLNGFSKTFLAPGYRAGYAYFKGADEIKKAFFKFLMSRLSAVVPMQYAAADAIDEGGSWIKPLIAKLKSRRDFAYSRLRRMGLKSNKPKSAFYIFPEVKNDMDFTMGLLRQKHVAVVHGTGFSSPNHFRMVFLPPRRTLEEALNRVEEFLQEG